jgi:hypothetical protein
LEQTKGIAMSWVAAAVVGSALLGANASRSASSAASDAATRSAEIQQGMFDTTNAQGAPYRQAGSDATARLADLLGTSGNTGSSGYGSLTSSFTPSDFLANKDPGYDFQLKQGQQALQNSQAASGGVLSGAALKGLIDYNQGQASTGYQNAWNRWNTQQGNTYTRLNGLASLGENAAVNAGNTGATYANTIGNSLTSAGNATASGIMGNANALSSGVNNYLGYNMNQQWLDAMNSQNPASYAGAKSTGYSSTPSPAGL